MRKTFRTKTSLLKKYGINAQINGNNELVLPTNNVVEPNRTLEFLNEDMFYILCIYIYTFYFAK